MKCTVGLGDIGKRFELTRHNISFEVVDYILEENNFPLDRQKFEGTCTIERVNDDKVLFIKPMTMMSLSGETVAPIIGYYNVNPEDLIVLYDDLDSEQGQARLRQKGNAGGHDGMKSIIKILGTDQFKRIRTGVGRPTSNVTVPDYILQHFSNDGMVTTGKVIEHVARAVEKFVETS